MVKDTQKNYWLPQEGRTIGELIAEARQRSGAEKLKGHDIMGNGLHMHWHIFPRWAGDTPEPGLVWKLDKSELNSDRYRLDEEELKAMKTRLNRELNQLFSGTRS